MAGLSPGGVLQRPQIRLAVEGGRRALQAGGRGRLCGALQVLFHFGDQALQAVDLPGQRDGARAFRLHVLLDRALLALPFVDQRGEPGLIVAAACRGRPRAGRARWRWSCEARPARRGRRPVFWRASRNSGTTDPSSMAVRSDCSASSGRTSSAGGVRRPARCSAASTSTISVRRESSELRICCSRAIERAQPRFGVADPGLDAAHLGGDVDQLRIELAAVLADRRDIGLEFLLAARRRFSAAARAASSSCSRCLIASGEGLAAGAGGGCGVDRRSARRPTRIEAGKACGQQRDRKRDADQRCRPRPERCRGSD